MCKTLFKRQTDRRQESNLMHLSLKMQHLVTLSLMIFLIINWTNFVYLLVDPGFYPCPINFYEASRFVPLIGCTPLTEKNRRVSLSVCLLDGVWHYGLNKAGYRPRLVISQSLQTVRRQSIERSTATLYVVARDFAFTASGPDLKPFETWETGKVNSLARWIRVGISKIISWKCTLNS